MTTSDKTDAIVQYFADRQKLECEKTSDDTMKLKLLQWNDTFKTLRIKPSNDIARFLSYSKDDLADVDFVLFVLEHFAWRQAYAVSCTELAKHLSTEGISEVDVTSIPASSYIFFDLMKANKYLKQGD